MSCLDQIAIPDVHSFGGLGSEAADPSRTSSSNCRGMMLDSRQPVVPVTTTIGSAACCNPGEPGHPVVLTSLSDDSSARVSIRPGSLKRIPMVPSDRANGIVRQLPDDLNFGPVIRRRPRFWRPCSKLPGSGGAWLKTRLRSPLTSIGGNGDGNLGGAMAEFSTVAYDTVPQAMIADGRPDESVLPLLPDFASLTYKLPGDPGNPFTISNQIRLTNSNAKALGSTPHC